MDSVKILGLRVDVYSKNEILDVIGQTVESKQKKIFLYLNAHASNFAAKYSWLNELYDKADVVYADGQGIRFASWMLTGTSDLLRQRMDEMFTRAGLDPPKPVIEAASTNFMRTMLLSADLVSMLPRRIIERELASGELVTLSPSEFEARRIVGVVQRRWASRSPACNMLLEELRTVCRQEMAEELAAPA